MIFKISFGLNSRPATSLGILNNSSNIDYFKKSSANFMNNKKPMNNDIIHENDGEHDDEQLSLKSGVSKVVRFDSMQQQYEQDSEYTCKIQETIIESFSPIPYADDDIIDQKHPNMLNAAMKKVENDQKIITANKKISPIASNHDIVEAINDVIINREIVKRGKLDKSYSTPTYDNNESGIMPLIFLLSLQAILLTDY
jgi:connector enhancer of kinase suppressor of Ras 2